jgi:NAD(P)-dependent dehydrogenase (short-subunit alcohol dehydrogenase family)
MRLCVADTIESRRSTVSNGRGTILLTGVGRRWSIGAGLAVGLAEDGWDLALRDDLQGLVMAHCESIDSSILDTTLESWDRHFTVNARASWLLVKAFAQRILDRPTVEVTGRIIALTSDHTAHTLPYGASKALIVRSGDGMLGRWHRLAGSGVARRGCRPRWWLSRRSLSTRCCPGS